MSERATTREMFWEMVKVRDLSFAEVDVNLVGSAAFGLDVNMTSRLGEWQKLNGVEFDNRVVGFGAFLTVPTNIGDIIYEDFKVVLPEFQGLGIGPRLTTEAIRDFSKGRDRLHLLARTQNDQEFFSVKKGVSLFTSGKGITPLDSKPDILDKQLLEYFLERHPVKRGTVDLETFIHKAAYKTYPDMTVGIKYKIQSPVIEPYLNSHSASKDSGDAIYLLAKELI